MTNVETKLLAALYLLYATECIHWLGPDEKAFTRCSALGWKTHAATQLSFTLLRRRPLLVDPFLLRPGFLRRKTADTSEAAVMDRALRRTAMRLNALWLIDVQCHVQAVLLLFYMPVIVLLHRLTMLWPEVLLLLLVSHVLLLISFFMAFRKAARTRIFSTMAPILLNPLGATRIMEVLSKTFFEQEIAGRRKPPLPLHRESKLE